MSAKEGLAANARWFLKATVQERRDAAVDAEYLISSLLVEMERLERVLPRYKAIVRAVAERDPLVEVATDYDATDAECHYCGGGASPEVVGPFDTPVMPEGGQHTDECPWRLARELIGDSE